jgi:two-component system KDP operon response regulator KdpE
MTRESDNSAHVLGDGKRPDSSTGTAEVIDTGDFHIDLGARQATLRGRLLDLTPAEFDLLVFLAGHPKSFVTPKTMLATNSTGGVRQAEFLRALLSLIRKLDSEFGGTQPYIRTEPWILYRFNPEASSLG